MTSGEHWITALADWLSQDQADPDFEGQIRELLSHATPADLDELLSVLGGSPGLLVNTPSKSRFLCQLIAARFVAVTEAGELQPDSLTVENPVCIYETLYERDGQSAAHMLQVLASQANEDSLTALSDLLIESPPTQWQEVGVGLSPLWHAAPDVIIDFFERVSDALLHPSTMAVLLDLANYSFREKRVEEHPWQGRAQQLAQLLNEVVKQLKRLETDPNQFGDSVETVQKTLGESLALTISLCDALGLIGDPVSKDSLSSAMTLSHRRVQTEAAGALAVLGEEEGKQRLLELTRDRAARLRAVTYAEELGFVDEIPADLRAPQALAESELASWLAAPEQYGVAPNNMELIDTKSQYWPSYEEPRDCFLFRYTYMFPQGAYSNIGIAGPLTHTFAADLGNMPADDIYAAFAGWQAEHEDIFEIPAASLNVAQRRELEELSRVLQLQELEIKQPIALTFFFGEIALLAEAEQDAKQLCAITDGQETLCYPISGRQNALTPEIVLCIYRGRKLLRTFNP